MNSLVLHMLAKQASDAFVGSGVPLDSTIAKLAYEHGLSPVQIQRVVEVSNHDTNDRLRATAEDKTFTFKIASVDGVLGELKGVDTQKIPLVGALTAIGSLGKTATDERLIGDIDSLHSAYYDASLDKQHTKTILHKLASRLDQLKNDLEATRLGKMSELNDAITKLGSSVKNFILVDRVKLSDIRKYACELYPDRTPFWNVMFDAFRKDLEKLGHPYTGQLASDKELMQDYKGRSGGPLPGAPVTVVNGNHALAIQLAPITMRLKETESALTRKREVDNLTTSVRLVEEAVDNNEDVERQLMKTAEVLLYGAMSEEILFEALDKLAEDGDAKRALKAGGSIAVGEAGTRYSGAVMRSVAKHVLANKQPGKYPGPAVPQYLRGQNSELI